MWDSPLFFLTLLGMAALAVAASYRLPRLWALFGLAVMVPHYAYQIGGGVHAIARTGDGLWIVGLIFLIPLTAIPVVGGFFGAQWRRRGDAGHTRNA